MCGRYAVPCSRPAGVLWAMATLTHVYSTWMSDSLFFRICL